MLAYLTCSGFPNRSEFPTGSQHLKIAWFLRLNVGVSVSILLCRTHTAIEDMTGCTDKVKSPERQFGGFVVLLCANKNRCYSFHNVYYTTSIQLFLFAECTKILRSFWCFVDSGKTITILPTSTIWFKPSQMHQIHLYGVLQAFL
jgi:hypothetical protein